VAKVESLFADVDLPANIAIVANAATAEQGTWRYRVDGKRKWIDVPLDLSDTSALVLPTSVDLRFERAPNWKGTLGVLSVRFCRANVAPPSSGACDISASIGIPGPWTAQIFPFYPDKSGNVAWSNFYRYWQEEPTATGNVGTDDLKIPFTADDFKKSLNDLTDTKQRFLKRHHPLLFSCWDHLSANRRKASFRQGQDWQGLKSKPWPVIIQRELVGGYLGVPPEATLPSSWTVPMACVWAATRDLEEVEKVYFDDPDNARWLFVNREPAAEGMGQLLTRGEALQQLQEWAAGGVIVVRGLLKGGGDAAAIPADAWANLQIRNPPNRTDLIAVSEFYPSGSWWSRLRVLSDDVRRVWPGGPDAEPKDRSSEPSQGDLDEWYRIRVSKHDPTQLPPDREDDLDAAKVDFPNCKVTDLKKLVRNARNARAPASWRRPGSKGRKRQARARRQSGAE
jgi:hypothetical protein